MFTTVSYDLPTSALAYDSHHEVGEAVLVTPCKRQTGGRVAALEEDAFVGHAAFAWRTAIVARPSLGAGTLRYRSYRQTASFSRAALPFGLRAGDRMTRRYDGVEFEVTEVRVEGARVTCDVREIARMQ